MNYSIFFKNLKLNNKGFTLVELIVVMAIAVTLITALVVQQNKWNDSLTVNTQAYELVLMIRQAQIYSLGVREYRPGSGDKFDIGYGVYFDSDHSRYIFFADKNGNKIYDASLGESVEVKTFTRGVTIDKICGLRSGVETCASPLDSVNASFFRPEPKAIIVFSNSGGNPAPGFSSPATIYLKSIGNKKYKITIEASGQISNVPI